MRAPAVSVLKEDLKGKIRWFIALRWPAAAGLTLVISGARFILGIRLPLLPLYLGNLFLILYNTVCYLVNRRLQAQIDSEGWLAKAHLLANIQISVDLSLLTYLIHFSGGLDNPFIFYYIFHMIISSILLTNRSAYLQATYAALLFGAVMALENLGILARYTLSGSVAGRRFLPWTLFAGRFLAFSTTLFIAVYLTTTIVNKLRERGHQLEVSNRLLAEQDRLKSRYVMTVSHDIQASLSSIESCLQTVLQGFTGRLSKQAGEMVQRASVRSKLLLRFVRDLLDVSRIRAETEIGKEELDLVEIIRSQAELFAEQVEEKGLALGIDNKAGNPRLLGNRTSLEQLFNNLLGNAVRYTRRGGSITVSIAPGKKRDTVAVRVADTGIGIEADSLPRIFDDFYRASNARAFTENGTGLGLSIVKQIVEIHGGEIRVESEVNKGTEFLITLHGECPETEKQR